MLQGQSALLAIGLLLTGLVFYLLVWGLLRFTARIPPAGGKMSSRQTGDSSIHKHAILLVRPGGTLDYLNQVAHEWFDLRQGEQPNLETLARRIQPRVDFLQLCANEGQARFSLNGRPVDGISYLVPGGDGCLLLTLRAPDLSAGLGETGPGVQSAALKILADFSATAAIEQGLASAIRNVLENIERLVPSELLQVQVWDAVEKNLAAYRLATGAAGERSLEVAKPLPPSGYAARIVAEHLPLLVADTRADASAEPAAMGQAAPRSYMGLPFISGGELVGVLEVGLPAPDAFSQEDLGLLQLVAGQAAAVIRNAAMLEEEQKRSAELGGLAHLAQAIGSARDQHDLFNRLVQSLTPLFDVEVLGFLVYNESRRLLEAQAPFVGIPPQVVELYHVPIQPGSQGEQVFLSQELVLAANAAEDDSWQALGLQDFARAASLRDAALVPLISGGRSLGYLQVSNHRTATAFQASEIRLLHIIANQAAAIIDNAALVQQARQRAQRADALLRIASLTSSSATLDEILRFALQELARMLQADAAAIFLLDESQGMLRLHPESLWGVDPALAEPIARLYVDDPQFHFSVTGSQRSFLSGHLSDDKRVLPLYRPIVDVLKIESAIVVPLVVRERGIGELMLSSKKGDFFNSYDLQIVATTAGQLAAAVEGTSLSAQTDENLRRRVDQLTELNRINRELSAAVERRHLLQVVYDESLRAARAECGSILLFAPGHVGSESPVVQASQGEEPVGLLLPAESQVFATGKPLIIPDFEAGDFEPPHEGVASALLAPIAHRDQVRGLIHLHSSIAGRFDDSSLEIIQTMAFQAAIALENNQRFQDQRQQGEALHRQVEALSGLLQLTRSLGTELPLEESLAGLAQGIQQASRFQMVLISVVDPVTEMQQRVAGAGIPPETMSVLKSRQQPWSALQQLLRPEFKQAGGYFIPNDRTPVVSSELQMVTLLTGPAADAPNAWNPEDTLLFPLFDEQEQPIGLISLDAPSNGLRPDRAVMETIDLYAATVALVIRASRRLETYRTQAETMNVSIQRQQQFYSVSQGHLPVMLHKDLEQMVSIRNIERRARRLRAGLEITEIINRQVDAQSALLALGAEMLTRLEMSVSIVAESGAEGPRLLHVLGQIPRGVSAEALFGQRNPLRQSLQTGETLLVMNLDEDETWRDTPLLTSLHAKGFICLPIILDEQPVAGILALSPEPMAALTEEDRQVYYQIARQVSIILQNIGLLGETRRRLREVNLLLDFSRQLGGLDPGQIVQSLLESALRVVATAHAGSVLLWDAAAGRLVPGVVEHYADNESMKAITYAPGEALPGRAFAERRPLRVDEVNFARDYKLPAENLIRYREATAGRLPLSSLLVPVQTAEKTLGVLVLDNFNTSAAFTLDDETLLSSLAKQVALALENVHLVEVSLERTGQLQALTVVSSTMTASLQSDELTAGLLDQLGSVLPYDTAILWLREAEKLSVAAARGFPDNEQRLGLSVAVADSALLAEMIRTSQSIVVGDIRGDPRFPALVEAERLSWMGVPLVSKGEVAGVIALEKKEAGFYTIDHTQLAATFASQAAVALDNARLYEDSLRRAAELDQRSQRLALLNRLSSELSSALTEDEVLRLTAAELLDALAVDHVWAVTFERDGRPALRLEIPSTGESRLRLLPPAPIFDRLRESLGVFSAAEIAAEPDLAPLAEFLEGSRSLLVLPMAGAASLRALVFALVDDEYRFSPVEIELARTICNQSAIALESARLYQATLSRAEQLATINRASYEIGYSLDPEEIYAAIHRATAQLMEAESFVISLLDEANDEIEGVYLMDPGGRAPAQRLPLGQGLSGRVIASGEPLLIRDVAEAERLGGRTFGEGQPRSIVAVPIRMSGKVIGMLSAQSYQPNVYTEEDQQILGTMANQAAVAIQNGRLFAETRRLADELEQRVVDRTAELEREKRNTETLLRILTEVSASLDLDRALNRTLALLNEAIGAEQGAILMLNPEDNTIQYRAGYGYVTPVMTEGVKSTSLRAGEGLAGWVIQRRQAALIPDVRKDKRWLRASSKTSRHRSVIATPLMVGEEVIGAIMVFHRQAAYFTGEQMNLVQAIGNQVAVAINNAHLYELIRDQAERLGTMLRNQQMEASRQDAILEAVADGVLVTDSPNTITFVNTSAERILNFAAAEVQGKSLDSFIGLFGDAAQSWMNTIRLWSDDPAAHQPGETYAEQLDLENGRVVMVHLAPVIWRNEFHGTVSIFRDITHEVEVDRLKSEFVATVSHELRTPMTSIKGYVDVLLMGAAGALNENQAHFLDIVRTNTERLNSLVNDLLDISRIEAGRVSLSLQAVDLREVVDDVMADINRRSQEESKPMAFTFDAPPDLPPALGDPERVRQITGNLVDNAYRYTPENGRIEIHIQSRDGVLQVDVQDNGIGIPPEDQERVFERFYRGESPLVLATSGTGLGLPIVKQLVEMHKGRIWMTSKGVPGEGSTFSFTLPLYMAEE